MNTGQIQLGVKRSSEEFSDQYSSRGFFYGGEVDKTPTYILASLGKTDICVPLAGATPARQAPNFSDNLCAGRRGSLMISFVAVPTAPAHLFYDIPSSKRDARCTNFPHTGALLTVKGVGQRLRKGFQEEQENGDTQSESSDTDAHGIQQANCRLSFGSLSSAAENKALSEKYEVMRKVLCLACNYRT